MTAHFDLAALGMLVAVAETGGFTAASARLGRTQSAISVRIQDLESQLGHKLLERSRRGVTPTTPSVIGWNCVTRSTIASLVDPWFPLPRP